MIGRFESASAGFGRSHFAGFGASKYTKGGWQPESMERYITYCIIATVLQAALEIKIDSDILLRYHGALKRNTQYAPRPGLRKDMVARHQFDWNSNRNHWREHWFGLGMCEAPVRICNGGSNNR
jgi:hypothetical protein